MNATAVEPDTRPLDNGADDWQDRANCLGCDPALFFPERGASTVEAKAVCRSCVVREECLDYALRGGERFGIWGGLSERERRRIRREPAARAMRDPSPAALRRVQILRLARVTEPGDETIAALSNAAIAATVGCHPTIVSTVLSAAVAAGEALPPFRRAADGKVRRVAGHRHANTIEGD